MIKDNVIQVGIADELASVIDKIVTSEARVVYLVVEDDSYIAQNILNLRLIKRESENVDKEVVVVSENPRIQNLASKASLKVKARLEEEQEVLPPAHLNHLSPDAGRRYAREVSDILPPVREQRSREHATDLRNIRSGGPVPLEHPRQTDEFLPDNRGPETIKEELKTKEPAEKEVHIEYEDFQQAQNEVSAQTPPVQDEELFVKTYDPDTAEEDKTKKSKVSAFLLPFSIFKGKLRRSQGSTSDRARRSMEEIPAEAFKPKPAFFKKPISIAVVAGSVVAIAGLVYLGTNVLPKATIVLNPYTVEDEMNFAVLADSNVASAEYSRSVIPAQILEERKEETFTYKATGTAQLEEFAIGRVRIYNEYSSSPQTLVANTRLMSSDGKLFRTTETVVVPGATIDGGKILASSIEVGVRADEAGQDYNIAPTTFSIPGFRGDPKYLAFYGKSESSFSGGFKGTATVPTEQDIQDAKNKINDEYLSALEQSLRNKVPDNLVMLEESLDARVESLNIDAEVGKPKEEFSVRFIGIAQVFLIRQEDISNAVVHNFINSTQYSKDFELSEERNIEFIVKEADYEEGYAEFNLKVNQRFNRIVDTERILEEIRGKDEADVRRILSANEALQRAQVRFWPFWVKVVPQDSADIEILIEYQIEE